MAVNDEIPKSRVMIRYETTVNGKKAKKELPLRLLVMGDLSQGHSKDRQLDIEDRQVRKLDGTNLDSTMKDMGIKLNLTVDNKITPEESDSIDVELPIENIKALDPASIASNVPQIQRLMFMKTLLKELQSTADNNKKFRYMLDALLKDETQAKELAAQMPNIETCKLPSLKLDDVAPTIDKRAADGAEDETTTDKATDEAAPAA